MRLGIVDYHDGQYAIINIDKMEIVQHCKSYNHAVETLDFMNRIMELTRELKALNGFAIKSASNECELGRCESCNSRLRAKPKLEGTQKPNPKPKPKPKKQRPQRHSNKLSHTYDPFEYPSLTISKQWGRK